jgi:hypothetical protein
MGLTVPKSIVFLEAFGKLEPPAIIDEAEEDLYSVFRSRTELMKWSTLWGMNEAELTPNDNRDRIGYIQVGSDRDTDLAELLPPLTQCLDDVLRRFGTLDLSAIQITASLLSPPIRSGLGDLSSGRNWFSLLPGRETNCVVTLDQSAFDDRISRSLMFEYHGVSIVHPRYRIEQPPEMSFYREPSPRPCEGLAIVLPEWSASAIGWTLAFVAHITRGNTSTFCARISKV